MVEGRNEMVFQVIFNPNHSMILKNYLISSSLTLKKNNPKCAQHSDEMLYKNPSPFSLEVRKQTKKHKRDGTRL